MEDASECCSTKVVKCLCLDAAFLFSLIESIQKYSNIRAISLITDRKHSKVQHHSSQLRIIQQKHSLNQTSRFLILQSNLAFFPFSQQHIHPLNCSKGASLHHTTSECDTVSLHWRQMVPSNDHLQGLMQARCMSSTTTFHFFLFNVQSRPIQGIERRKKKHCI